MSSPVTRAPAGRRAWVEPALWIVVPVLFAVVPWAARQWSQLRLFTRAPRGQVIRLTGDSRRDRLMLLERAWAAARPDNPPSELPEGARERLARREAIWLSEIATQMLAVDPMKADQAALEAARRLQELPERMGPEELLAPGDTPTGRLLQLARAFAARAAVADRLWQAAREKAWSADWPGSRVYALCLVAQSAAGSDPARARAALHEATTFAAGLQSQERAGALAGLAGSSVGVEPEERVRARAARALKELEATSPGPVARAVAAALVAPAVPESAERLAERAVRQAGALSRPPEDHVSYRGPFGGSGAGPGADLPPGYGWMGPPPSPSVDRVGEVDAQQRRVAAALALTHPTLARRAAAGIRRAQDRSGALIEIATLREGRDPEGAAALYRQALVAADQIRRPVAARRAARVRAAAGLAAFDAPAAVAVIEDLPLRLLTLQINDVAVRLARSDPEAALRLIERSETTLLSRNGPRSSPFTAGRAAVAEQIARDDPHRAAELLPPIEGRRALEGWLALARGMGAGG